MATDLGARRGPAGIAVRTMTIGLLAAGVLVLGGCSAGPAGSAPSSSVTSGSTSAGESDVIIGSGASSGSSGSPIAAIEPVTSVVSTSIAPATDGSRVIVVKAVGKVTGTPDTVSIQIGVQTTAPTAGAALDANSAKANAVIAVLKGKGVADPDLQTSDLSISPTYTDSGNTITGYQVTNTLTVTLHGIDRAGAIIDAAQSAAGDAIRINQLSFSIDDSSSLRTAARTDAVKQATASATELAAAAGVALGQVVSITEDPDNGTVTPIYAAADSAAGGSVPIQAGSQDLTVTVQMVFAIV